MLTGTILVIGLIMFLPILPLLVWDIVRIMWVSVPVWGQVAIVLVVLALGVAVFLAVRKLFRSASSGGRTQIHNHYY